VDRVAGHHFLSETGTAPPRNASQRASPQFLAARQRVAGIEPAWPAWKAGTLPLSYTRETFTLCAANGVDKGEFRPRASRATRNIRTTTTRTQPFHVVRRMNERCGALFHSNSSRQIKRANQVRGRGSWFRRRWQARQPYHCPVPASEEPPRSSIPSQPRLYAARRYHNPRCSRRRCRR
jgi:hypothetical protein